MRWVEGRGRGGEGGREGEVREKEEGRGRKRVRKGGQEVCRREGRREAERGMKGFRSCSVVFSLRPSMFRWSYSERLVITTLERCSS